MIRKPRTEKNFIPEDAGEMTTAACLNRIFKKVEIEGLSEDAAEELAEDIRAIADKFSVCPKAAIILAAILEKSGSSNGCDEEDLANFIGCTNIEFIGFHEAIRELEDNSIICTGRGRRKSFCVSQEALKAVEKGSAFEPVKMTGLTTEELFTRFRIQISNFRNNCIDGERLLDDMEKLIEKNQQLLFCRKVSESDLMSKCSETERRMFYYMCHRYVSHGNQSVPVEILMNFTEFIDDDQRIRRHISLEKTGLQTAGMATFGIENGFADETSLALSDDVKQSFFDEIELAPEEKVNHKDLISCESIKEQELFYNPKEEEQIERLAGLLENENFVKVQERLEEQGMPKGFSCLFAGTPGTGKTASLKALAKRTGRDILMMDLAFKSKWVGESEQNIKNLFQTYRNMVRTSEKAPILAVNEADAIFTKRITNVEQSTDQMNNAITDIVLNELETLDGILIATTNLAGNMMGKKDNAMERRFLYKVEFKAPGEEVRAKIWKSKLKGLTDAEAATLAERFAFSGGNIENVARKSTVEYVLSGKRPDLDTLMKYCEEETLTSRKKEAKKIGFTA